MLYPGQVAYRLYAAGELLVKCPYYTAKSSGFARL